MKLQENPFQILGVNTDTTATEIDEIAEDKSFEDDNPEMETVYKNASSTLVNPKTRILAEIHWFCGMTDEDIQKLIQCIKNKQKFYAAFPNILCEFNYLKYKLEYGTIDEALQILPKLDELYKQLTKEEIIHIINTTRKDASFPIVQDTSNIIRGLQELREDIHNNINVLINPIKDTDIYIQKINRFAEENLRGNVVGILIEELISTYRLDVQEKILKEKKYIESILKSLRQRQLLSDIPKLEEYIHKFSDYIMPLIWMSNNKGERDYGVALDITGSVRDVGIDLYNKYHATGLAVKVFEILVQYFPHMGEFSEQNKKDLNTLRSYMQREKEEEARSRNFKDAQKAMEDIINDIDKNGHFEKGYVNENKQFCYDTFERCYIKIIYEFLHRDGYSHTEWEILNGLAAIIYRKMAALCTWFDDLAKAGRYIDIAREYAQKSHKSDLINEIREWKQKFTASSKPRNSQSTPVVSNQNDSVKESENNNSGCGGLLFCLIFLGIGGVIAGPVGFIVALGILIYLGSKK